MTRRMSTTGEQPFSCANVINFVFEILYKYCCQFRVSFGITTTNRFEFVIKRNNAT